MTAVPSISSCMFNFAPSLDSVSEQTCVCCGKSEWSIIAPNTDISRIEDVPTAACIFIAPNGSTLVVHLLELLLATNFGLTLNNRIITKGFKYKSSEEEQKLALELINEHNFPYPIRLGIKTLMSCANIESFRQFFRACEGSDVCTIFPLIKNIGVIIDKNPELSSSETNVSSSSSSSSSIAEGVSLKRAFGLYVFSSDTIIFITVIRLTNGVSKVLETPFPQKHLTDFLNNSLPNGKIVSIIEPPSYPPTSFSIKLEDVVPVSSVTDGALDEDNLTLTTTVILNTCTQFEVVERYDIKELHKDLQSYKDVMQRSLF